MSALASFLNFWHTHIQHRKVGENVQTQQKQQKHGKKVCLFRVFSIQETFYFLFASKRTKHTHHVYGYHGMGSKGGGACVFQLDSQRRAKQIKSENIFTIDITYSNYLLLAKKAERRKQDWNTSNRQTAKRTTTNRAKKTRTTTRAKKQQCSPYIIERQ